MLCMLTLFAALAAPIQAAPPAPANDDEVHSRIDAIQQVLDARATRARVWQYGWTGVGVAATGAFTAVTLTSSSADDQVDFAFALGGTALDTVVHTASSVHPGVARTLREAPASTPEEARAKLALAEDLLRKAALAETDRRSILKGHVLPDGLPIVANLVLALGWDHVKGPVTNTAASIVINEVRVLTAPRSAAKAYESYEATGRIATARPAADWMVLPTSEGLVLAGRF